MNLQEIVIILNALTKVLLLYLKVILTLTI